MLSGQLRDPAALAPEKSSLYPFDRRLGGPQSSFWESLLNCGDTLFKNLDYRNSGLNYCTPGRTLSVVPCAGTGPDPKRKKTKEQYGWQQCLWAFCSHVCTLFARRCRVSTYRRSLRPAQIPEIYVTGEGAPLYELNSEGACSANPPETSFDVVHI
jgi:hypothetical protein